MPIISPEAGRFVPELLETTIALGLQRLARDLCNAGHPLPRQAVTDILGKVKVIGTEGETVSLHNSLRPLVQALLASK